MIEKVLKELDQIIETSVAENNALGIFAYVYRRTTEKIKEAVDAGRFEDNPRMERFDVRFAGYYIDAYHNFRSGKPVSAAWKIAFQSKDERLAIMQHLVMGMNAHINLDLGVTAAYEAPGEAIHGLRNDFMTVNAILTDLTNEMQTRVSRVSPMLFLLGWLGHNSAERLANFSIVKARDFAWKTALHLAPLEGAEREAAIRQVDAAVADIGGAMHRPPGRLLPAALALVARFEERDIAKIIAALRA